jgi:tetratricopeptide (TPR) repeat protein
MVRINKQIRSLILIMSVLVLVSIVITRIYYRNKNASADPRVTPARELYENYNRYAAATLFDSVFLLMDTIESIYQKVDHYANSFEVGVLYNNRGATWLTMGLFGAQYDSIQKDSIVNLAESAIRRSITIYKDWKEQFGGLESENIPGHIRSDFLSGLEMYSQEEREKFLQTRVEEITDAQSEIERRLSVSHSNLGMVHRHRETYDSAAICYQKALELWDRNLTAENNLNILLGRPLKKRNFIERMFPPERLK